MTRELTALSPDEGGMDHPYIDEADLRARYVLQGLSPDEEQRFEAHLVACVECQEAVENELALRDGLREFSRTGESGFTAPRPSPGRHLWQTERPWAVAASLLLVLSAAMSVQLWRISVQRNAATAQAIDLQHQRSEAERSAAGLAARLAQLEHPTAAEKQAASDRGSTAVVFALTRVRGAKAENGPPANRLRMGGAKWAVLTLDLGRPADSDRFVATLSDVQSGVAVWSGGPFETAAPETLTLALDAALLHPGDFMLQLERRLADGQSTLEGQYSFRVMAPMSPGR